MFREGLCGQTAAYVKGARKKSHEMVGHCWDARAVVPMKTFYFQSIFMAAEIAKKQMTHMTIGPAAPLNSNPNAFNSTFPA